MKSIIGKNSCNSNRKIKFTINNEIVSDSQTVANAFNTVFTKIGPAFADKITCSGDPMSYVDNIMNSTVISYATCMDVKDTILSLKNSSPGYNELPASISKQCIDNYVVKYGESDKVTNYIPISVLSFFSKIFENIIYNYVVNFMDKNDAIYKYHAIITLVDKITSSLDSGDIIIGVFLDLKKHSTL